MPKIFSGGENGKNSPEKDNLPAKTNAEEFAVKSNLPDVATRVPPAYEDIQVNYCKTPNCENFAIEPLPRVSRGRPYKSSKYISDGYRIIGNSTHPGRKFLYCTRCQATTVIKSNKGVKEEINRISDYLLIMQPACPNETCKNHKYSALKHPYLYNAHGSTSAGSPRWKCKSCGKVFSQRKRNRVQLKSHENKLLFNLLMNKNSIRAMARITELSPKTIYNKIDFIHRQCMSFIADREREMPSLKVGRFQLCTDRQDYIINWSDRKDRRNSQLTAVATADNRTGYVFPMNLNFDPNLDPDLIEGLAITAGDYAYDEPAFREYARLWMELDFKNSIYPEARNDSNIPISAMALAYGHLKEEEKLVHPEENDRIYPSDKLPKEGMQVHFEYTVHAHYRLLRRLLPREGKYRFYMDQDDTLRAGCLSAFAWEIKNKKADAFFVRIAKNLNVDERREKVQISKTKYRAIKEMLFEKYGEIEDWKITILLLHDYLRKNKEKRYGRDIWIEFPRSTMNEPDKAVAYLTDIDATPLWRLASMVSKASLHGVDRYFMQLRRMIMALERPISTPSNDGRVWRGYSPYNPRQVQKLLDIYRVYYNYVKVGQDKKTPAMRLGLAKGLIRTEDILYFKTADENPSPENQ